MTIARIGKDEFISRAAAVYKAAFDDEPDSFAIGAAEGLWNGGEAAAELDEVTTVEDLAMGDLAEWSADE